MVPFLRRRAARIALAAVLVAAVAAGAWAVWRQQPGPWSERRLERSAGLLAVRQVDAARAELRTVLRRLPLQREARWQLVQIELRSGRLEHAYLEVKSFTELHPDSAEGWLVMASLMTGGGLLEEAEIAADHALAADPTHVGARALRAGVRLRRARYYGAWVDARTVLDRAPEQADIGVVLSPAAAVVEGNAAAIDLTRGLLAQRDAPALRLELARRLVEAGRTAEAQPLLNDVAATGGPVQREADLLRTRLALRAGRIADARTLLDGVIARRPADEEPVALRALIDAAHGDLAAARSRLDGILSFQPQLPLLRGVRDALERDPEGARGFLRKLVDEGLRAPRPLPTAAVKLHRAERRERGQLAEAHAMIWPGALAILRRDSDRALQQKDWSSAKAVADRAEQAYPGTLIGPWIRGVIELAQDRPDSAEAHFRDALTLAPRSGLVIKTLAQLWAKRENAARAGERLAELVARDPAFALARRHAANTFLNARLPDRAEAMLRAATGSAQADAGAWSDLAFFYLDVDRAGEALRACQAGQERFPQALDLRALEARVHARTGQADRAIEQLEAVLADAPDRDADAAELARLRVAQGSDGRARALELVARLEQNAPSDVTIADAIGWTHVNAGAPKRGLPWLAAAAAAAPERPDIRFHLGAAHAALGERASARAELQQALASGAPFAEQLEAQRLLQSLQ